MKRLILTLGIGVAALAISTPASAQTGCRWYDVNCRLSRGEGTIGTAGRVDSSWQLIGHDRNGNAIYQRRRVDGNGNVVIERARRDALGRMVIIDRDIDNRISRSNRNNRSVNNSRRYEKNGMICTYKENSQGYKEHCKYRKNKSGGLYRINDVYRGGDDDWDDDDDRSNRIYRTNKVRGDKYRTASVNSIYRTTVSGDKYKVGKANSNKYNKGNKSNSAKYRVSNGKAKGHDKH